MGLENALDWTNMCSKNNQNEPGNLQKGAPFGSIYHNKSFEFDATKPPIKENAENVSTDQRLETKLKLDIKIKNQFAPKAQTDCSQCGCGREAIG